MSSMPFLGSIIFFRLCRGIELSVIAGIVALDTCLSYLFEDIQGRGYILVIFNSPALNTVLRRIFIEGMNKLINWKYMN